MKLYNICIITTSFILMTFSKIQNLHLTAFRYGVFPSERSLLPAKLEKDIEIRICKFLKSTGDFFLIGKENFFYKIANGKLHILTDERLWKLVNQSIPKKLEQQLNVSKNYLLNLTRKSSRVSLACKTTAINHILEQKKLNTETLRKLQTTLAPISTILLSVCVVLEKLLSPAHFAVRALSLSSAGYPLAGCIEGKISNTELKNSKLIENPEGISQFKTALLEAKLSILGGVLFFLSKFMKHNAGHVAVGTLLGLIMTPLYVAVYGLEAKLQLTRLQNAREFRRELNSYLKNPVLNEGQKAFSAIQMIKSKIDVTQEERDQIVQETTSSHLPSKETSHLIQEKLENLHLAKVQNLERRIGLDAVKIFLEKSEGILGDLERNLPGSQRIAEDLLKLVLKENSYKILLYAVLSLISIIGMVIISAILFI